MAMMTLRLFVRCIERCPAVSGRTEGVFGFKDVISVRFNMRSYFYSHVCAIQIHYHGDLRLLNNNMVSCLSRINSLYVCIALHSNSKVLLLFDAVSYRDCTLMRDVIVHIYRNGDDGSAGCFVTECIMDASRVGLNQQLVRL